ncbi:MAG: DUF1365 domain-containing protein [Pseudomonadales bacterium]|nr:DUF1365 domain-containing protein [Pseudomonadales bacterium]
MMSTQATQADNTENSNNALHSCVYRGQIYHKRHRPHVHEFDYLLDFFYLDLDEISDLFQQSKLVSVNKTNLVSFQRQDYLPSKLSLKQTVIDQIHQQTGQVFKGRVCLLATLRSFGYCMNPIALFYCYDNSDKLAFVVVEVNNTPWDQRHVYVIQQPAADVREPPSSAKAFHVSPFMPMDTTYIWRLGNPQQTLNVSIKVSHSNTPLFDASMKLQRINISAQNLNALIYAQAMQAFRTVIGIYFQAAKLWLKKLPLYAHPDKKKTQGT